MSNDDADKELGAIVLLSAQGFGFLSQDNYDADLFVPKSELPRGVRIGDRVRYRRAPDQRKPGKVMAVSVELI